MYHVIAIICNNENRYGRDLLHFATLRQKLMEFSGIQIHPIPYVTYKARHAIPKDHIYHRMDGPAARPKQKT